MRTAGRSVQQRVQLEQEDHHSALHLLTCLPATCIRVRVCREWPACWRTRQHQRTILIIPVCLFGCLECRELRSGC